MKTRTLFVIVSVCCILLPSCSINQMAMRVVADALTGDGSADVWTGDSDPKLVGDALPFAIKLYETLLDANPNHLGLMFTTGSLFIMYSNAYVQTPAEMLPISEWREKEAGVMRAKQLYLRGYNILYDALDIKHPGFRQASVENGSMQSILARCRKEDAGLLYWAVLGGLAAYSIDLMDFELSGNIPEWSAMIHRAYELDPDYNNAAIDEFFIIFYASLPEILGGDKERAKFHFQRAMEKTGGSSVSAYVSYAQTISVPEQDYETFRDYLEKALAIDPDANPSMRLVTIVAQQRAQYLLDNDWMIFSFLPIPDDY